MSLQLPFGIQPVNPAPVDAWSGPYSAGDETTALNLANSNIPSDIRFQSMEVRLIIDGISRKYWYRDGVLDNNLVEFVGGSGGTIVNFEDTDTIGFTQSGDTYSAFILPDSITASLLSTVDGGATAGYLLSNDGEGNFKWVEGGDVLYQNVDIVPVTVGGIDVGSSFSTPTPIQDVLDQLLYPELFPNLNPPSSTFESNVTGLREIGSTWSITFTSNFSRGSISPAYGTNGFRSGLPNSYEYTGFSINGTVNSVSLSDTQSISNYEVILGNQSWQGRVNYDAGVQPNSNKGNDFGLPLPAGSTNFITRTITGVYPFFATSQNITTLTKQPLVAHNSQFFQINLVATVGSDRQRFQIPSVFSQIVSVRVFNSTSNQYEFPGGSAQSSLTWFAANYLPSSILINVNSNAQDIPYFEYISPQGESIGPRQMRLNTN